MVKCQESQIWFSNLGIVNFGICLLLSASPFLNLFVFFSFFFFYHFLFLLFVSNFFSKHFPSFCNEPARAALDYFPFHFSLFSFLRCSFPGPHQVPGQNPSCSESLSLTGQRFFLCLPSISSLYLCFFQLLKPFILPIPSARSLSYSAMVRCELSRL